jgi:hypothetical protein
VVKELESGFKRDGLWAKALAETDGDSDKAHAKYIRLRVMSIKEEARSELLKTREKPTVINESAHKFFPSDDSWRVLPFYAFIGVGCGIVVLLIVVTFSGIKKTLGGRPIFLTFTEFLVATLFTLIAPAVIFLLLGLFVISTNKLKKILKRKTY